MRMQSMLFGDVFQSRKCDGKGNNLDLLNQKGLLILLIFLLVFLVSHIHLMLRFLLWWPGACGIEGTLFDFNNLPYQSHIFSLS